MGNALLRCIVCQDKRTYQTEDLTNSPYYSASLLNRPPRPLSTLKSLDFIYPLHFSINSTTITRTDINLYINAFYDWSSVLSDPFTSEIVSVTITILSISDGFIRYGLMDSTSQIPFNEEALGRNVKNSVSLSRFGSLHFNTPSSNSARNCHSHLNEGDCVRMEVDLDSTPRTVQFFVNGEAGRSYVSGIPSSVRIGFSVKNQGTSFRIDNISRLSQPTPISDEMMEVKW